MKDLFIYIVTNERRTTLYIGVTNDLQSRVWQHGSGAGSGFTGRYNLGVLIYFEVSPEPLAAIAREKQLKGWSRAKKEKLIATMNPQWRDLGTELFTQTLPKHGHPERSGGPALRAAAQSKDPGASRATPPGESAEAPPSVAERPEAPRGPSTASFPSKQGKDSAQDDRGEGAR